MNARSMSARFAAAILGPMLALCLPAALRAGDCQARTGLVCDKPMSGFAPVLRGLAGRIVRYRRSPGADGAIQRFLQAVREAFPGNQPPFKRSVALLVGLAQYQNWHPLPAVYQDIAQMRDFLLLEEAFDDVYVMLDYDANPTLVSNILLNSQAPPLQLSKADRFLFYYSGHGSDPKAGDGYLIFSGHPTGSDYIDTNYSLPVKNFEDYSKRNPARQVLFLMDGCATGLGIDSKGETAADRAKALNGLASKPAHWYYPATKGGENSYAADESFFTQEVLAVLRGGAADPDSDGYVMLGTAAGITQSRLFRDHQITPGEPKPLDPMKDAQFIFLNPRAKANQSNPGSALEPPVAKGPATMKGVYTRRPFAAGEELQATDIDVLGTVDTSYDLPLNPSDLIGFCAAVEMLPGELLTWTKVGLCPANTGKDLNP